jgi:prevent-host-death family protein
MPLFRPSVDVRPVTEFRAHTSEVLEQVQTTKRPVVLTQHGRSAAVLLDVGLYEELMDEVALLRDLAVAEAQIDAGMVVPHEEVAARLREQLAE